MNKFKKMIFNRYVAIFFLLILYIFVLIVGYTSTVSAKISDSVFRLHVVANSDTNFDQELKYKVRDAVISYFNSISKDISTKEQAISLIDENINNITAVAKSTILENGYNYDVTVSTGNFEFPTKVYGDVSLPAGMYDAVKIEIGEAKGQNWWCVMFPPLCFVDVTSGIVPDTSKEVLQGELDTEEYNLLVGSNTKYKFKFKLLELFGL